MGAVTLPVVERRTLNQGLWPYDWGHVMGQASSGPQPFTGSLELNGVGVVVVLSFNACRRKLERLPFISAHFLFGFFILMAD